jgi:hypothetical protein
MMARAPPKFVPAAAGCTPTQPKRDAIRPIMLRLRKNSRSHRTVAPAGGAAAAGLTAPIPVTAAAKPPSYSWKPPTEPGMKPLRHRGATTMARWPRRDAVDAGEQLHPPRAVPLLRHSPYP